MYKRQGDELGAKGVVLNNAVVQGIYGSYKEAVEATVELDRVYEPDMKAHEKYMKVYELYKETYERLRATWKLRGTLIRED